MIVLQFILTWATLSGFIVLGLHTAIQMSPDFRALYMRMMEKSATPELMAWGREMVRRFGGNALLFAWSYYFFLPALIVIYPFVKYAAVIYRSSLKPDPPALGDRVQLVGTVKGSWNEARQVESLKAAEKRLHGSIARVAYEALTLTCDVPSWNDADKSVRERYTERVSVILADPDKYEESLDEMEKAAVTEEQKNAMAGVYAFHLITLTCIDGLQDNGINLWPVKVPTGKIDAEFEGDEESDLFPKGPPS